MIEGPKFAGFDFSPVATGTAATSVPPVWLPTAGEPFVINGHRIVLPEKKDKGSDKKWQVDDGQEESKEEEEAPLSHTASTAKSVWDCSIILSKYLEALSEQKPGFWTGKRVLELGAGQGIASLSAAALGAERVIVTDVESAVPGLEQGVALNGFSAPQVQVTALDWTNREQAIEHIWNNMLDTPATPQQGHDQQQQQPLLRPWKLDYILASDVIWVDYLIPALVDTMSDLLQSSKERRDSVFEEVDNCNNREPQQGQQHTLQVFRSNCSPSASTPTSPVVLLAYQFRSTRSDQLLFNSLDQLGLSRRKLSLSCPESNDVQGDAVDSEYEDDDVYVDSKFRQPNLSIWKIWKN
ncbi:hypothetical protein BGZ80_001560 [Entomortierella chlamydospora]|uniref:Nicotinamide n-methyltransferase n=1 Tax=Entomortierella chlamydospora TaxID=101097 RepID=A0A9P6N1X6_9FUNG|nr:hypothetical protein BGZ80_001560 [Entomortierella chlamydospora]